jgi:hypothetical protein
MNNVNLKHTLKEMWEKLKSKDGLNLQTSTGTPLSRNHHDKTGTTKERRRSDSTTETRRPKEDIPFTGDTTTTATEPESDMCLKALDENI